MNRGVSVIVDFTWTDSNRIMTAANNFNVPYIHADASSQTFLKVMENYLRARGANDVVHIFDSTEAADSAIYFLITESQLRTIIFDRLSDTSIARIKAVRPYPSYFTITAKTSEMNALFRKATAHGLVLKPDKWNLMFLETNTDGFEYHDLYPTMSRLMLDNSTCCMLLSLDSDCKCPAGFKPWEAHLGNVVTSVLEKIRLDQLPLVSQDDCSVDESANRSNNAYDIAKDLRMDARFWMPDGSRMLRYNMNVSIWTSADEDNSEAIQLGTIEKGEVMPFDGQKIKPTKRYFRVGTAEVGS